MTSCIFKPGDKVFCVDARASLNLLQNKVYMIDRVVKHTIKGKVQIHYGLCGVVWREWSSSRFKKATEAEIILFGGSNELE